MASTFARGGSGKGKGGPVNDIGTGEDVQEYTTFAKDILALTEVAEQRCARGFIVSDVGAGTKLVEAVTAVGQTRLLDMTNLQGVFIPLAIRTLTANTTVARILVFW